MPDDITPTPGSGLLRNGDFESWESQPEGDNRAAQGRAGAYAELAACLVRLERALKDARFELACQHIYSYAYRAAQDVN
jgi:hypothetical protein